MRTHCFHDFDEFANSVQGVESKMLMRNPQQRCWTISHVQVGDIEVQVGKLGSGNVAAGQLRSDGFMIYVPLTKGVEYAGNGVTIDPDSFCILEPDSEFCVSTKVAHDWAALFLATDLFAESVVDSFSHACRVTDPNHQLAELFRVVVGEIMNAAVVCPGFESSRAATQAAAEMQKLASQVIGHPQVDDAAHQGRPKLSRSQIIQRSMQLMEMRVGNHVTVVDLASASDISERTLRTVFNEYFGVGPVRYLQLRELHSVRRTLLAADSEETTVSQVLADHEEWAFSRFASRYRKLFGELPSETLRRRAMS